MGKHSSDQTGRQSNKDAKHAEEKIKDKTYGTNKSDGKGGKGGKK